MDIAFNSLPAVLDYYLRTLHDAEVRQIKMLAKWAEFGFSPSFRKFLSEHQRLALRQRDDLKELENTFDVLLSGATCHPVQGFLHEAEKIIQCPENNIDLTESILAQLLQCIKHYEIVTYQAALVLARTLEEQEITSTLTKIVLEEEQVYLKLQSFVVSRRQNAEPAPSSSIG